MKNLIPHQQQAYEGAKTFYNCYLLVMIVVTSFMNILESHQMIIVFVILIGTYLLARRYYNKCHDIDTYLQFNVEEEQNFSDVQISKIDDCSQLQLQKIQSRRRDLNKKQQYCEICKLQNPYRSRHCYKCRRCVIRYDHHCFWIGNCVGGKNHKQFYFFLLLQTINNVISEENIRYLLNYNTTIINNKYILILYQIFWYTNWIISIGFILFTLYLFLYHSMLICTGMTTWQHLRRDRISYLKHLPSGYNPFSKGFLTNISTFFSQQTEVDPQLPTQDEIKNIKPSFNIINNQYYSCC